MGNLEGWKSKAHRSYSDHWAQPSLVPSLRLGGTGAHAQKALLIAQTSSWWLFGEPGPELPHPALSILF